MWYVLPARRCLSAPLIVSVRSVVCPQGAICEGGLRLPYAKEGFFPSPEEDFVFLECQNRVVWLAERECVAMWRQC